MGTVEFFFDALNGGRRPVAACRALEKLTFTKIALVVHK